MSRPIVIVLAGDDDTSGPLTMVATVEVRVQPARIVDADALTRRVVVDLPNLIREQVVRALEPVTTLRVLGHPCPGAVGGTAHEFQRVTGGHCGVCGYGHK